MAKNRYLTILLALLMLVSIPSFVMADSVVAIDYTQEGKAVIVNIVGPASRPVSITIKNESKYYYIDQGTTNDDGKVSFNTTLNKGETYDCKVNIDGHTVDKRIVMKGNLSPGSDEKDTANLFIKGYNGVILDQSDIGISSGETVLDLTKRILNINNIDYRISGGYISMIDGQKELDKGKDSGWMYSVNGEYPDVGAGVVRVWDGDGIKWLYSYDLGEDIGGGSSAGRGGGAGGVETKGNTVTLKVTGTTDKNKISKVTLEGDRLEEFIEKISEVKNKEETNFGVHIATAKEALGFSLSLPQVIFEKLKDKNKSSFIVKSDIGTMKLDYNTIKEINKNRSGTSENIEIIFNKIEKLALLKENDIETYEDHLYDVKILIAGKELSDFKGGIVELFFPLKLKEHMKPERLSIKHIKSNGEIHKLKNVIYDTGKLYGQSGLIAPTDSFSLFVVSYDEDQPQVEKDPHEEGQKFNDLPMTHWAYNDIMFMANRNLIKGTGNGKFEPNRGVTRAEFTQMIANISGENIAGEKSTFIDVLPNDWYFRTINWASYNKIIAGVSSNQFMPATNISRQDAVVIMKRYLDYKGYKGESAIEETDFNDINKISPYAKQSVEFLVGSGFIYGKDKNMFDPNAPITRSEATSIVVRILKRLGQ